jgi:hypothetical protein
MTPIQLYLLYPQVAIKNRRNFGERHFAAALILLNALFMALSLEKGSFITTVKAALPRDRGDHIILLRDMIAWLSELVRLIFSSRTSSYNAY